MNSDGMRETLVVTKALSDLQRIRILMLLRGGELCVCQIIEVLGLAASTVSKHLSILDNARLVASRKTGRWMHYRLPENSADGMTHPLLSWMDERLKTDRIIAQDARKLKHVLTTDPETLCRQQRSRNDRVMGH